MKRGRASRVMVGLARGSLLRVVLISLSPPGWRSRSGGSVRLAHLRFGSSGDQSLCGGPCRHEWLVAGEHVPDGLGELAGDLNPGDLGAALLAQPAPGRLVVVAVAGVAGGVGGRLDQRPPKVFGAVLGQRAAMVAVAGLVDPWAQPRVAAQLLGRREPADVAKLGGDRVP